ncbi:MAG: beta-galactosidase [Cyclobacteriaceae bacterium]
MNNIKILFLGVLFLQLTNCKSQPLEEKAFKRIRELESKVKKAESLNLDVLREKMTLRTAEIFLKYADWDENHVGENKELFEQVTAYKDSAEATAILLPDFERKEVILMLDEAILFLDQVIAGEIIRKPTPDVDWEQVSHGEDQITYQGRPVFLSNYTWKPKTRELMEYHGQADGFFLKHGYVVDEKGTIDSEVISNLKNKKTGKAGFIFLNHKGNVPDWAEKKYGPDLIMREDTYTSYDIDNPGARELNKMLLAGTVPYMSGKKYSMLGYMLCNEPHFYTTEDVWATGPVSEYTIEKFKIWLTQKHRSIESLNTLWESDFSSFNDVEIEIPISQSLQGTPKWFDWVSFNMDRVTDWYRFLQSTIHESDPDGKVHLKIMPNLWTENTRNHGIDMEALTRMSEIIGNDTGSEYNYMWGKEEWDEKYIFNWREMSMGHDFYTSVSPNKIMFNSEAHYLSTGKSRDLYMTPRYARATYWLATTQGMDVSQTWYWSRNPDGSPYSRAGKAYGGSNNQQPRIVNEVASTIMDLNAHSELIMQMQRQRKPIRIFYSKTSAINKAEHMDDVFELYESIYFEGIPLGFVTEGIFKEQAQEDWDVVLIRKTPLVTQQEIEAIQNYLNQGGTILMDSESLQKDEYGRSLKTLDEGSGTIIEVNELPGYYEKSVEILEELGSLPQVVVEESNEQGIKGCTWKCVEDDNGNNVLSIVNLGRTDASLKISFKESESSIRLVDVLTRLEVDNPVLKPYEVLFVEVQQR